MGEDFSDNGAGGGLRATAGNEAIDHDDKFIEVIQNPHLKGQGKSSSKFNSYLIVLETIKFKKDASNGLSSGKMEYHIDKTHPRILEVDPICNIIK